MRRKRSTCQKELFEDARDAREAKGERDAAVAKVADNNVTWLTAALAALKKLPVGWTGTGEGLRLEIGQEVGQPKHHNAWGALVLLATRRGHLEKTGELAHLEGPRSHARLTPVYRKVG
jgi:hypothetical protein